MNGFLLSLCDRKFLSEFIGVSPESSGSRSVVISYNLPAEAEVRALYEELKGKGVKIIKEPTVPYFGGLFFYFEDVEGNILEVAYNSLIPLDEKGNATGHKPISHL